MKKYEKQVFNPCRIGNKRESSINSAKREKQQRQLKLLLRPIKPKSKRFILGFFQRDFKQAD